MQPGAQVISAFDNDTGGDDLAAELQELVAKHPRTTARSHGFSIGPMRSSKRAGVSAGSNRLASLLGARTVVGMTINGIPPADQRQEFHISRRRWRADIKRRVWIARILKKTIFFLTDGASHVFFGLSNRRLLL